MPKSKLKPTTEEAFAVGRLEGEREVLEEIKDYLEHGLNADQLMAVVKSRIKILTNRRLNDPFKQKEQK